MFLKSTAAMIVAFSSVFLLLTYSNILTARKDGDVNNDRRISNKSEDNHFIISCVGDSITNGSSVNISSSYPAILRRHFNPIPVEVHNFGSNGQTVLKSSDHSYWLEEEYRRAFNTRANYVIIQFGTNDAKPPNWNEATFRLDYINLIERFQCLPSLPAIFICIPPPIYCPKRTAANDETNSCWKYAERSQVTNNLLQHVIADISFQTGATLINNFKLLGGEKLLKPEAFFEPGKLKEEEWTNIAPYDGIHPNEVGNEMMAANIFNKILDHNRRLGRLLRYYKHHKVIQNNDQVHNSDVIAATKIIRSQVKHDAVYSHIYNHTINGSNAEGPNAILRPLIVCIGVSCAERRYFSLLSDCSLTSDLSCCIQTILLIYHLIRPIAFIAALE